MASTITLNSGLQGAVSLAINGTPTSKITRTTRIRIRNSSLVFSAHVSPKQRFCLTRCLPSSSSTSPILSTSKKNKDEDYSQLSFDKLYVHGISFNSTEDSLRYSFSHFGQVVDVKIINEKISKRPRGFAFVTFASEAEASAAIEGMDGKFLDGRIITVELARQKPPRRLPLPKATGPPSFF